MSARSSVPRRRARTRDIALGNGYVPNVSDLYLASMRKPRGPSRTFIAMYDDLPECPVCFVKMEKGERLRLKRDGTMVHFNHKHPEPKPEIFCNRCFLANPCECE